MQDRIEFDCNLKIDLRCRCADGESALGLFVPLNGKIWDAMSIRCSLKIELCDKLEPLKNHLVGLVVFESFKITTKSGLISLAESS